MATLRPISRQASEMAHSSSPADNTEDRRVSKQTTFHKRKISASKSNVVFKSQTWSNSTSKYRATFNSRPTTSNKRAISDPTTSTTVTKQQSRFASLFISLLAVSPMAIEYDAADQETMEAAQKASVKTTQPASSRKTQSRSASAARPSEIRKTRWKRFKYEMGLKMRNTGKGKMKDRRKWSPGKDVELDDMQRGEREVQRDGQSSS